MSAVCFAGSAGGAAVCCDTNRLNKMKAGSVIGCRRDTCEVLVKRKSLNKLLSIMNNPDHPLYHLPDR